MKKLMALVLSVGMVLLGTVPVMAAGQNALSTPIQTSNSNAPASVEFAVPAPIALKSLDDKDLMDTTGKDGWSLVIGALSGAAAGAANSWLEDGKVDRSDVVKGALGGAVANYLFPGPKMLEDAQVFGRAGTVIYNSAKATIKGAVGGFVSGAYDHIAKAYDSAKKAVGNAERKVYRRLMPGYGH